MHWNLSIIICFYKFLLWSVVLSLSLSLSSLACAHSHTHTHYLDNLSHIIFHSLFLQKGTKTKMIGLDRSSLKWNETKNKLWSDSSDSQIHFRWCWADFFVMAQQQSVKRQNFGKALHRSMLLRSALLLVGPSDHTHSALISTKL